MFEPWIETVEVNERDSCQIEFTLTDEAGDPPSLSALTMTLYNGTPDQVINFRNAVDVLGANGGSYDAGTGVFTMNLTAKDNRIVDASLTQGERETHFAQFVGSWGSDKRKAWLVRILVAQFRWV